MNPLIVWSALDIFSLQGIVPATPIANRVGPSLSIIWGGEGGLSILGLGGVFVSQDSLRNG